jgi:imidazolonepropionase-like amidohydrolase
MLQTFHRARALALAASATLALCIACSEPQTPAAKPTPVEKPAAAAPATGPATQAPAKSAILIKNVRIFDGKSDQLTAPMNVLVVGNTIQSIAATEIAKPNTASVTTIDGGGRVLMPGLIDAHWHAFMAATSQPVLMTGDPAYLHLLAAQQAEATLMRGFTTVRDLGGPVFGLKRAIDEGVTVGPRIYPSGAMISQTSGHADFRFAFELPRKPGGQLSNSEREGIAAIADSADEVRLRAREQLRRGASQIKVMGGGGVSSIYNPIESTQFTVPEIRAAVEAAENWGTYVAVHAYTPRAMRQAIEAGAKCIDHGQLTDDATAQLMAEKGVWWSLQPLTYDAEVFARMAPISQRKALEVFAGTENAYKLARKYKVKTAWGADILFDARAAARQGQYLAMMTRWYTPAEALKMATGNNGELLALSGFSNPYPGQLGVITPGAFADLLLVEGDPLQNLNIVADPAKNFLVIMKDGRIYKNILPKP